MIKLHNFPKWWLPDVVEFVEEIPKTSLGNFKKSELRERFAQKVSPAARQGSIDRAALTWEGSFPRTANDGGPVSENSSSTS